MFNMRKNGNTFNHLWLISYSISNCLPFIAKARVGNPVAWGINGLFSGFLAIPFVFSASQKIQKLKLHLTHHSSGTPNGAP